MAVSSAEMRMAAKPRQEATLPSPTAARPIYHLLTKPLKGGMPVRAQAAAVKQANVRGIRLPNPSSSDTYSRWA